MWYWWGGLVDDNKDSDKDLHKPPATDFVQPDRNAEVKYFQFYSGNKLNQSTTSVPKEDV